MLAEAEKPELVTHAFDDDYGSAVFNTFVGIARGQAVASDIDKAVRTDGTSMLFSSNHDQNSWLDSDIRLFGEAAPRRLPRSASPSPASRSSTTARRLATRGSSPSSSATHPLARLSSS